MSQLTITIPAGISISSEVSADDLETVFAQIETFHNTPGWCGANNVRQRGINSNNLANSVLETTKIAIASFTGRVLANGAIIGAHIDDGEIYNYNINWNARSGMMVKAQGEGYPMYVNRKTGLYPLVQLIFGNGVGYLDFPADFATALEGSTPSNCKVVNLQVYTVTNATPQIWMSAFYNQTTGIIRVVRDYNDLNNVTSCFVEYCAYGWQ